MPGSLRVGSERSWIDGAVFTQECDAAASCPSAATVTDSLIGFLVTEHNGVLIVEIDLTKIGPVSRAIPFGSDPARSAPLRDAAPRTAQTMATEKTDRSRTEFSLCMGSIPLRRHSTSHLTIQNLANAFRQLATWTLAKSKTQAPENTQATRRRRPSFGRTPRTHSIPRGVTKQACQLPDDAFLRRYDDQIHNEPSGPEPRASEPISGETIAVRHPQEPISTSRRLAEFASLKELAERVEPVVSMNGAYRRNVRPYGMVKKERGRLPTSGESAANALDRWDEEGGAAATLWPLPYETGDLLDAERRVLECLGAALVSEWNGLPTDVQRRLFQHAASGTSRGAAQLKSQIARFLHDHKDASESR
jgi:hypothetical protein